MKLSRTGWNNVIIFAVMAFILLINVTNNKIFSEDENTSNTEQATLFGAHATILTLTFYPNVTIERIGKTWRSTPATLNEQGLEQMMRSWKHSEGDTVKHPPLLDEKMALVVKVELAGQDEPHTLNLYATDTELLIFNRTTLVWKSFPLAIFSQLVPNEIFSV
ncbi:hypothetical protein [Pseudocolwellia agarivorans]|uniref:hypothetical protein n=1 Tax=Pseudocolwellia agarivorans TaxID=1911682 RepID=UPI0009874C2B|nr:hypothetical protein [Pseudocolwellia agarivorans]